VVVLFFGAIVIVLGFSRFGVVFEGAAGSQNVPSGLAPSYLRPHGVSKAIERAAWPGNTCFYGTGLCWKGQTRGMVRQH
jgi:hypothetical protein